jgi:hypothetical protein
MYYNQDCTTDVKYKTFGKILNVQFLNKRGQRIATS